MRDYINAILYDWDMEDEEVKQIYDSVWQVGDKYVLKVYDNVTMLERNIRIISILSDLEIPVGRLIPNRNNLTYSKDEHNYYILTERLKGSNIVGLEELDKLSYKMGKIIADLHNAFLQCEKQDDFWENNLLLEMKGWIADTFIRKGWGDVNKNRYDDTLLNLESLYGTLPVQLIHRDVHFGNFLFDNGNFSGYIDFDLSQKNIRIFDICYFVLGLLSEEEKVDITQEKWFEILKDVFRGYNEVNKLSLQEIKAVPYVMKSIELLFAAWFLNQNDKKCSENAVAILNFIDDNMERIMDALKM
ncbi:MAG: phosphotransferase [Lachnospiraceae bacterium]|nr:phosphotransferase [Lachnospiraceae bacterium]